jgi:preprotein translocase subunit SecE
MRCDLAKGQKEMTKLIFPQKPKIITIFVLCFVYKHFVFLFCESEGFE